MGSESSALISLMNSVVMQPGSKLTGRCTCTISSSPAVTVWPSTGTPIWAFWARADRAKRASEKKDFILKEDWQINRRVVDSEGTIEL